MVKKILAIDGGGMYGVVAAQACIQIEEAMGGKKFKDIFNLFVGTSTGALICSTALMGDVPDLDSITANMYILEQLNTA